ncbi:hypothetical protein BJD99_07355 [Rhodococcus sp. 1163]|uniref:hypothetical protein n=1 Tax=Rhodococcus sp. 1163 TaxID=1905289 RepID=UPI000A0186C0|nr:hypothetical protein [Rhodococcus sp. 1163]ORI20824.1 hypothetical protein BJD99_07355 [Rhodococcus sp. 1163]
MDDADFDDAVRAELTSLDSIKTYLQDNPGRHAAPESDLAEDEDRLPHIWVATTAQRALLHACECIEASSALMLNWNWSFAQFALLRAAYESAGSTVWLLIPEESDLRLARLLCQHNDSWKYSAKAYMGTPLDDGGEHQARQQWTTYIAAEINIDLKKGRSGGFENLIDSIEDLPDQPESLLTAWRVCSGVSHAKTWAMTTVTTEVDSAELYEHGRLSGRVPNLDLFLTHLRVARRTVQRAWVYYQIRTTPRPHPIALRLEKM